MADRAYAFGLELLPKDDGSYGSAVECEGYTLWLDLSDDVLELAVNCEPAGGGDGAMLQLEHTFAGPVAPTERSGVTLRIGENALRGQLARFGLFGAAIVDLLDSIADLEVVSVIEPPQ